MLRIGDLHALRVRQPIRLNPVREIGQRLFRQVHPRRPGSRPQPLDEIRPRSEADFHDPLAVVSRELGKGMDERLLPVTPLLDLLEVLPGELLRLRMPRITGGAVPKRLNFGFKVIVRQFRHGNEAQA